MNRSTLFERMMEEPDPHRRKVLREAYIAEIRLANDAAMVGFYQRTKKRHRKSPVSSTDEQIRRIVRQELADIMPIDAPDFPPES